jgi:hypothetical protein
MESREALSAIPRPETTGERIDELHRLRDDEIDI